MAATWIVILELPVKTYLLFDGRTEYRWAEGFSVQLQVGEKLEWVDHAAQYIKPEVNKSPSRKSRHYFWKLFIVGVEIPSAAVVKSNERINSDSLHNYTSRSITLHYPLVPLPTMDLSSIEFVTGFITHKWTT